MAIIQSEQDGVRVFKLDGRIMGPDIQELKDTVENIAVNHGDIYSDHVLSLAAEIGELTKASILGLALSNTTQEATDIKQQMESYLRYYDVETEFLTALGFTVTNVLENAEENDCDLIALSASHHGRLY